MREKEPRDLLGARVQANVATDDFWIGYAPHIKVASAFLKECV
jgi:hypothetical protein